MHSETGVPRIAAPVEQFLDALATVVQTGLQKVHRLRPARVGEDAKVFTRISGSMHRCLGASMLDSLAFTDY